MNLIKIKIVYIKINYARILCPLNLVDYSISHNLDMSITNWIPWISYFMIFVKSYASNSVLDWIDSLFVFYTRGMCERLICSNKLAFIKSISIEYDLSFVWGVTDREREKKIDSNCNFNCYCWKSQNSDSSNDIAVFTTHTHTHSHTNRK